MIPLAHDRAGLRARRVIAALLFVLAQTLAWPAPQDAKPGAPTWIDGTPICHSGASDESGGDDRSGGTPACASCLLCHAVSVAAIVPEATAAAGPLWRWAGAAFRPAFAHTSPPHPVRASIFPTGPPPLA